MALAPNYRFTYHRSPYFQLNASDYEDLKRAIPGFEVEAGMACSLATLFHLAPNAAQFEPDLFTKILPTLHQSDTLVVSLYTRTDYTDFAAVFEKTGEAPAEDLVAARNRAERIGVCAQRLEKKYLSNKKNYSRIVWMVVTDAPYLKGWMHSSYDTRTNNVTVIPREIATTSSLLVECTPEPNEDRRHPILQRRSLTGISLENRI